MILSIIPELIVVDIELNINFFSKNFGFKIKQKEVVDGKTKFVELENNNFSLYLQALEFTQQEFGNFQIKNFSSNLILFQYESKKEFLGIYNNLKNHVVPFYSELKTTSYNTEEFAVLSPDNYIIECWRNLNRGAQI